VELVRAGVGNDVDQRAGMQAIACRQAVRLHRKLTQGVGKRVRQVGIGEGIGVGAAVEHVIVVVALAAGYRDNGRGDVGFAAHNIRAGRGDGAARDKDQLRRLPTVQRQLGDTLLIDNLLVGAGFRLGLLPVPPPFRSTHQASEPR